MNTYTETQNNANGDQIYPETKPSEIIMTIRKTMTKLIEDGLSKEEVLSKTTKSTGCTRGSATRMYRKITTAGTTNRRTLCRDRTEAFRATYDKSYIIPQKVDEIIREWLSLPEIMWSSDEEMRKKCAFSIGDWKVYARENAAFEKYLVHLPGKKVVWAYSEEYARKLQRRAIR